MDVVGLCQCDQCPLAREGKRHPVPGQGPQTSPLVVVGEAPGYVERQVGVPFSGPSGRILDGILQGLSMPRSEVFVTNTVLCSPLAGPGQDASPPKAACEACLPRLVAEVTSRQAKIVLALGRTAAQTLLDTDAGIGELQGVVAWSPRVNAWVLPTFHPAAVLHAGDDGERLAEEILRSATRAVRIARGEDDPTPIDIDAIPVTHVRDEGRAYDVLTRILTGMHGTTFALDLETAGFDAVSDPILVLALATQDKAVVFDAETIWGPDGERKRTWALFRRILTDSRFTLILHNCSFDLQFLARDFDLTHDEIYALNGRIEDTMCWALGTTEKGSLVGLKRLSRELVGAPYYEDEVRKYLAGKGKGKGEGYSFTRVPRNVLARYGGLDTVMAARLLPILKRDVAEEGTERLVKRLLIPAQLAFVEIERDGTFLDLEYVRALKAEWEPKVEEKKRALQEYALAHGFDARTTMKNPGPKASPLLNPGSPKQLAAFLYGTLGLPPLPPPPGRVSPPTGKEFRDAYPDHPVTALLADYTKLVKLLATYVDGIVDDARADERVHPSFLLYGTITGRLSIHNPPLQTIPAEYTIEESGVELPAVRPIFSATPANHQTNPWKEDLAFVSVDYERLELNVAWLLTRDQAMGEACLSGDFHRTTAARVFAIPEDQVTKEQRRNSKLVTFGIMYGRGAASLAKQMAKPEEAEMYVSGWLETFKGYAEARERWAHEVLYGSGRLTTPYGRVRRWLYQHPDLANHIRNQAYNFPIQSVASDITLEAMITLNHELRKRDLGRVLFTVHDSINFEVRLSRLTEAITLIREVMEHPPTLKPLMEEVGVPKFGIEISAGTRWGDHTYDPLIGG